MVRCWSRGPERWWDLHPWSPSETGTTCLWAAWSNSRAGFNFELDLTLSSRSEQMVSRPLPKLFYGSVKVALMFKWHNAICSLWELTFWHLFIKPCIIYALGPWYSCLSLSLIVHQPEKSCRWEEWSGDNSKECHVASLILALLHPQLSVITSAACPHKFLFYSQGQVWRLQKHEQLSI